MTMTKTELLRIRRFIVQLGRTMHEYGTPSHRLEHLLTETTRLLGLKGEFLVSPTSLSFVFWAPDMDEEYTHIARVNPSGIDLSRLSHSHELVEHVLAGRLSLEQGMERLAQIRAMPDPYPRWLEFMAWGVSSAGFATLCGATPYDIVAALLAGWLVFGLSLWAEYSSRMEEMLEPLAALLIALLSSAVVAAGVSLDVPIVVLSGVIVFIPGLSLTLGLRELAARHLLSGTGRIMDASMMTFKLYFGAVLGLSIGQLVWGISPPSVLQPIQANWTHSVAILGLTVSLLILFKIRWRDAVWGLVAGALAYTSSRWGSAVFGASLGGLVGALTVGLYANAYAQIKNTPTQITLLPGVVLLVPGSKVYMGLNSLVSGQDIVANAASGAQVFLTFMSIVAGLMFANVLLPPRHRL